MHNVKVKDCILPIHCLQFVKSENFDSMWLSFCPFRQKSCNSLAKELGSVLEQHSKPGADASFGFTKNPVTEFKSHF